MVFWFGFWLLREVLWGGVCFGFECGFYCWDIGGVWCYIDRYVVGDVSINEKLISRWNNKIE